MAKQIYIIDDEPDMIKLSSNLLKEAGFQVTSSTDPAEGLKKIQEVDPDLLLLDLQMPEIDGFEVCRKLRAQPKTKNLPIIIISVQHEEADVVAGLELGANDYIQKPIRSRELVARVKALLRNSNIDKEPEILKAGPIQLDLKTYTTTVDGKSIDLRPKEFELLALLIRREGQVLTRPTISNLVWKTEHLPTSRTINTHILRLRTKLGPFKDAIQSLKGIGYRFEIDE